MEGDERVVVRLSGKGVDLLNDLASRHVYESVSAAARAAIEEFLIFRFYPEERVRALSDAEKPVPLTQAGLPPTERMRRKC